MPVCAECLRSPEHRRLLMKALRKGQAKRRTANNWKESS